MIPELKSLEVKRQNQRDLGDDGVSTWRAILSAHEGLRKKLVVDLFEEGVVALNFTPDKIPDLNQVNETLMARTGFQGMMVEGLEDGISFYGLLANRIFPIGNFIRDRRDLNYTPAPDIVHDMYGHLPFLIHQDYADFCQAFGEAACEFANDRERLRQFERFFWFTIEFGLIKTSKGRRVFGAGIASSLAECKYSLSDEPEVRPFDVDDIRKQEFRIDQMQTKLFLLESPKQLYESLPQLIQKVKISEGV